MADKIITIENVTDAKINVRQYTTKWADLVAEKMTDKKEIYTKARVYNIINGTVKNQLVLAKFIKAANKVAEEVKAELESAL